MDVAVYLFTGFLEAGKTTLIQQTLEDEGFNSGEPTLVLSCEEGIEELDFSSFAKNNVFFESIDTISRLNPDKLSALQRKYKAERVLVEYNGMWMNEDFYRAMPEYRSRRHWWLWWWIPPQFPQRSPRPPRGRSGKHNQTARRFLCRGRSVCLPAAWFGW